MTKLAVSFGLTILLATITVSPAQPAPTQAAVDESVYRTANLILLRQKLADARVAASQRDLSAAATLYDNAVELAKNIGPSNAQAESAEALQGLAASRLQLADLARKRSDWREAETQINRVLKEDPKNPVALQMKAANDKTLNELAGLIPSQDALQQAATAKTNKIDSNTLVQDAAVLMEAGKLDEADAKLKEAIRLNPENRAAYYYMDLVKERRFQLSSQRHESANRAALLAVSQAWEPSTKAALLPVPNPYNSTNLIHTGKGRQTIVSKLGLIRFDSVQFDGLPLSEVVRSLSDEARKRDPEKKGINIIVNPNSAAAAPAAAAFVDPATGLPVAAPPVEAVDVGAIAIKLNQLNDVRLADVLDAVVKVAEKPLKVSYEEYAVVISLKGAEPTPLFMREFNVDPNTFIQGLESVGGFAFDIQTSGGQGGGGGGGGGGGAGGQGAGILSIPRVTVSGGVQGGQGGGGGGGQGGQGGQGLSGITTRTNNMEAVSAAVRQFFITLGVNLDPLQGKSVFFNDRKGVLLVRATVDELDIIEQVIHSLNVAPPQVNIKAKFTEISQGDNKALGFDWFLGNTLVGGDNKSVFSGGSQPSMSGLPSPANPNNIPFPGTSPGTGILPSATDQLITSGLRNGFGRDNTAIPALATFTGILTDPQFRVVVRAIDQRSGIDLLSEGEVTTLSGRQSQIQVVELKTIVTGVDQQQGQQGTAAAVGTGTTVQAPAATFVTPTTQLLPFGPTLDVLPSVSADGYTIQMTIIPTLTEFVGYDLETAQTFVPQAITGAGQTVNSVLPLPIIRLRQVTTSCIVWDGQTVVLGGLIAEVVIKSKDKVPFLGDLPFLGKFFTSESSQANKKNLVIFVTPTIIDPAGNRAHSEEEMPFAARTPGQ